MGDVDANGGQEQLTLQTNTGSLTLGSTTGLTFSAGTATSSSFIQVTGTLANLNAALTGLTFNPPASPTPSGSLQVTINDQGNTGLGGPKSANATVAISVNAAGNPPTIYVTGGTTTYTELTSPVVIDSGILLVDSGTSTLTIATVTLSGGLSEDVLGFTSNGGVTGTYSSGVLTLTGSANISVYQSILDNVTYQDTSNDPNTSTRTVGFQFKDANNNSSNTRTDSIAVLQVDQAPTIALNSTSTSVLDEGTLTFNATNSNAISVADVDANGGQEQLTLQVSNRHFEPGLDDGPYVLDRLRLEQCVDAVHRYAGQPQRRLERYDLHPAH